MAILQHIGRGPKSEILAALQAGSLVVGDLVVTTDGNELVLIERENELVTIKSRTQEDVDFLGTTIPAGSDIETVIGALADVIADIIGELPEGKTVAEAIADAYYDDTQVKADIQANADAIAAVDTKIGDLAEDTTVVEAIAAAKAEAIEAATYDDTQVKADIKANSDAIAAHKELVDGVVTTLVGDDSGKSVRTIANEELAAQLLTGDADADFETLQQLARWLEDHPEDAAAMNLAISNLQTLIGTIPEGATATDIVGYIAEVVAAEKARAEEVEGGLDERIAALEEVVGEGGSVADQIATAKQEAIDAANGYTDGKIAAEVTARDEAIATAKQEAIDAANGYTDGKIAAEVTARDEAIAAADATTLAAAKAYTDESIAAAKIEWVDFGASQAE